MIKINNIYKFAWFSELAYVKWADEQNMAPVPSKTPSSVLIDAAKAAQSIPGDPEHPGVDNLGDRIFEIPSRGGLGWRIAAFQPDEPVSGLAGSLYVDGAPPPGLPPQAGGGVVRPGYGAGLHCAGMAEPTDPGGAMARRPPADGGRGCSPRARRPPCNGLLS